MYAIIHKGRVILGPIAWAQKYFTDVLKIRHRVDASIPFDAPEEFPYRIDDDTTIHKVVENKPNIDAMIEQHYGPLWDLSNDVVVANYEVVALSIEDARNNFRYFTAFERYKKEVSGTTTTIQNLEVTIGTTRDERSNYVQQYLVLGDQETINWKFPQGWLTLTKQEFGSVVQAISQHVQQCFDWEKSINDQINAAQSASELYAIEITEK